MEQGGYRQALLSGFSDPYRHALLSPLFNSVRSWELNPQSLVVTSAFPFYAITLHFVLAPVDGIEPPLISQTSG